MSIVLEINELDDNNSDIYTNDEYKTSESDDKRTKKPSHHNPQKIS